MDRSTHTFGLAIAAASLLGMTCMAGVAFAQDCASPVTQADLGRCAHEEFLVATEAYAVSYKTLAESLAQKPRNQLRRTQKAWIHYRTAACDFESGATEGGSVQDMVKWQCATRMTRARTEELVRLINCPEGDVSCVRPSR
ncbi:MAG: lysozyme inhibitor LprI family protein [Nitrosospira sp.]